MMTTGGRVRNAYATYLQQEDSPWKHGLILYKIVEPEGFMIKDLSVVDGHAYD